MYDDADYVNFDMAEGAQWNESLENRPKDRVESRDSNYIILLSSSYYLGA